MDGLSVESSFDVNVEREEHSLIRTTSMLALYTTTKPFNRTHVNNLKWIDQKCRINIILQLNGKRYSIKRSVLTIIKIFLAFVSNRCLLNSTAVESAHYGLRVPNGVETAGRTEWDVDATDLPYKSCKSIPFRFTSIQWLRFDSTGFSKESINGPACQDNRANTMRRSTSSSSIPFTKSKFKLEVMFLCAGTITALEIVFKV